MEILQPSSNNRFDVVISSTSRDLSLHRKIAKDAIWRCNMFPLAMERDTATDSDAVEYSQGIVDQAHIYIGLFGRRYGYVPNKYDMSITEIEYRRAIEREIPLLMFIMDEGHPVEVTANTFTDHFETDPYWIQKLEDLKSEITENYVVGFFSSPDDLGQQIYQALDRLLTKRAMRNYTPNTLHSPTVNLIPPPPKAYKAHKYVQTQEFYGRESEITAIDKWAKSDSTMMILEAIGGIGKSSLKWHWMNTHAKHVIPDLAGIIWWSFYESDATVINLVHHALSYVTLKPLAYYANVLPIEREDLLFEALKQSRYLFVLDGLERILAAYHRMDAPRLHDDEAVDSNNLNAETQISEEDMESLPLNDLGVESQAPEDNMQETIAERKNKTLRQCTDPRDGLFLQRLVESDSSKTLISTRLTPSDLQDRSNQLLPKITHQVIEGLDAGDALDMMLNFGIKGHWGAIRRFMADFGYHPLVLSIVAGHIINYPPAPRNFNKWYENEWQKLNLLELDIASRRTHILQHALAGLPAKLGELLSKIAAFRYPVDYSAVSALSPFDESQHLHNGLLKLEDRGLLFWDRIVNRYDLHPIVRAFAFEELEQDNRRDTFAQISDHFESLPPENLDEVKDISDVRRTLEIYHALVNSDREDDAARIYGERLNKVLQYKIAAYHQIIELLEPMFPNGIAQSRIQNPEQQSDRFRDLINAYSYLGEDDTALKYESQQIQAQLSHRDPYRLGMSLRNYANLLYSNNELAKAQYVLNTARKLAEAADDYDGRAISYFCLMEIYNDMGLWKNAEKAYEIFTEQPPTIKTVFWRTNAERHRAEMVMEKGDDPMIVLHRSWRSALQSWQALGRRHALLYRGELALKKEDYDKASDLFEQAIVMARQSGSAMEAKIALGSLARTKLLQGKLDDARKLIEQDVSDIDAAEVYANLEPIPENLEKAEQHALAAYKKAWADGLPFIWWWQLQRAIEVLKYLNIEEPKLPGLVQIEFPILPFERKILDFIQSIEQS